MTVEYVNIHITDDWLMLQIEDTPELLPSLESVIPQPKCSSNTLSGIKYVYHTSIHTT